MRERERERASSKPFIWNMLICSGQHGLVGGGHWFCASYGIVTPVSTVYILRLETICTTYINVNLNYPCRYVGGKKALFYFSVQRQPDLTVNSPGGGIKARISFASETPSDEFCKSPARFLWLGGLHVTWRTRSCSSVISLGAIKINWFAIHYYSKKLNSINLRIFPKFHCDHLSYLQL